LDLLLVDKHEKVVDDLLKEKEVTLFIVVDFFAEVVYHQVVDVKVPHYSLSLP